MIPSFPSHFAKLVNKRTKEQFFLSCPPPSLSLQHLSELYMYMYNLLLNQQNPTVEEEKFNNDEKKKQLFPSPSKITTLLLSKKTNTCWIKPTQ